MFLFAYFSAVSAVAVAVVPPAAVAPLTGLVPSPPVTGLADGLLDAYLSPIPDIPVIILGAGAAASSPVAITVMVASSVLVSSYRNKNSRTGSSSPVRVFSSGT